MGTPCPSGFKDTLKGGRSCNCRSNRRHYYQLRDRHRSAHSTFQIERTSMPKSMTWNCSSYPLHGSRFSLRLDSAAQTICFALFSGVLMTNKLHIQRTYALRVQQHRLQTPGIPPIVKKNPQTFFPAPSQTSYHPPTTPKPTQIRVDIYR
jgi:hypothetical protein